MASMIKSDTSQPQYAICGHQPDEGGRMSMENAVLTVFGLSALGWVVVLGPLFALFH